MFFLTFYIRNPQIVYVDDQVFCFFRSLLQLCYALTKNKVDLTGGGLPLPIRLRFECGRAHRTLYISKGRRSRARDVGTPFDHIQRVFDTGNKFELRRIKTFVTLVGNVRTVGHKHGCPTFLKFPSACSPSASSINALVQHGLDVDRATRRTPMQLHRRIRGDKYPALAFPSE